MTHKKLIWIKSLLIPEGSTSIFEAQLKLFYLMLSANVFKGGIYLFDAYNRHQGDGSIRAIRLILTSVLMMVALRVFPKYLKAGIFWAVSATVLHIYYRAFNQNVGPDVITLQAIVMVIISSFYGLNARWGVFYTTIACAAPILCHYINFRWTALEPLPEGLNDIYIGINFLVILMSHMYFHGVLFGSLHAKEVMVKELKKIAENKTTFLSTMAHELRTPLNSVIGIANLLVEENKDQKEREHLEVLKFSAENLLSLVNDILDINKLESGKLELDSVPFNCNILISSVCSSMTPQVEKKSLLLCREFDPLIKDVTYEGDATRLSQILFNLIGNAVKFTEKGSVTISLMLLSREENRDLIRFKVVDTGIGITLSQQEIIFDPFVQAEANTTRKFGGTGLGLSIVKQLVEMFGSKIQLDSTPGVGTAIHFDLLLKRSEKGLINTKEAPEADQAQFDNLRILLAEDNMMNIYFMQQLFRRWNIKADVAENGEQAVQLNNEKQYDVILMDVNMPIMNGLEATERIRSHHDPCKSRVHIIALTAEVSEEIKEKLKEHGINDYLPKPFPLEELKTKLTELAVMVQTDDMAKND
jgi:signal transduction histidine kinase/CheY-like chemotaxis protein